MNYETLKNGTKVYISDNIRFGCDALILANFASVKKTGNILDLGTGCGIIPLALIDGGSRAGFVALEIDEVACALTRRSAAECGEAGKKIDVVLADLNSYAANSKFDAVICNPPYFAAGAGRPSADMQVRAARHEMKCTINDIAETAQRNLKQGGSLFISYRPNRLADAMYAFRANRLEPKRLRFVRNAADKDPWLVLIDARFDAGVGLEVLPDLIAEDGAGGYSAEMAEITEGCVNQESGL